MSRAVVAVAYATAALALAVQWTAAKVALASAPPLELSTIRFAVASALFVFVATLTRTPLPLHRWKAVTAAAACGFLGFNAIAFVGLHQTPASDSALIVPTTIPLATALLAIFVRERLTAQKAIGFGVATAGTIVVIIGGQSIGAAYSSARLVGDLLELAAAICWAACLTISFLVVRAEAVVGFVTMASLLGTAMLFPLGFFERGYADVPSWSRDVWVAVGVLGVVSTFVAFLIFFWAVHRFGPSRGALISYLAPVAGLFVAFAVLGERPAISQLVGGAIILAGVRLVTRVDPTRSPAPTVAVP